MISLCLCDPGTTDGSKGLLSMPRRVEMTGLSWYIIAFLFMIYISRASKSSFKMSYVFIVVLSPDCFDFVFITFLFSNYWISRSLS